MFIFKNIYISTGHVPEHKNPFANAPMRECLRLSNYTNKGMKLNKIFCVLGLSGSVKYMGCKHHLHAFPYNIIPEMLNL